MKIFVAGATGAIGMALIPLLVEAGHQVTGMTTTPGKVARLERVGARAVIADGLDRDAVVAAVRAAGPDVIVHQMTALDASADLRKFDRVFRVTNQLRTTGLDHLIAAAKEAGTRRMIAQSFCGWPYAMTGSLVKDEDDALDPSPARQFRRTLEAIRYLEQRLTQDMPEGLALRYGVLYGPGTGLLDRRAIEQIGKRRFPLVGNGGGCWSLVHVKDAALATFHAIHGGERGIYNIVDDKPALVSEWLPALAELLNAPAPPRLPKFLVRILGGDHLVRWMTRCRAGSNAKAKQWLGWKPTYPSWHGGFAQALAEMKDATGHENE